VSVNWTAPPSDGSAITAYAVTALPGRKTCVTNGTTACTVFGLTNDNAYVVSVVAINARGTSSQSFVAASVTPQSSAGGSADVSYLGPVLAEGESPTAVLQRDAGLSVTLPNGRDLWIFGDTGEFADASGWTSSGFVSGSTAAKAHDKKGEIPASLRNIGARGVVRSDGRPTQFLPSPTNVYLPDGSRKLCTASNGGIYSARWPTGAALLPDEKDILVSFVDVCVQSPTNYSVEGWGFMEYAWRIDRIRVEPVDVFPPTMSGSKISPVDTLGSPLISNGSVTFFSSACTRLSIICSTGNVYSATVADTMSALQDPQSYVPHPIQLNDPVGWQPMGIAVSSYPNEGLKLVEQTSIGGTFEVLSAPGTDGPWTPEVSGTLPGCSTPPHGFCYTFVGHPELSNPSQLVISYFKPDAGPDVAEGHLVLASVSLDASPSASP
jgi:hypothetical protein